MKTELVTRIPSNQIRKQFNFNSPLVRFASIWVDLFIMLGYSSHGSVILSIPIGQFAQANATRCPYHILRQHMECQNHTTNISHLNRVSSVSQRIQPTSWATWKIPCAFAGCDRDIVLHMLGQTVRWGLRESLSHVKNSPT